MSSRPGATLECWEGLARWWGSWGSGWWGAAQRCVTSVPLFHSCVLSTLSSHPKLHPCPFSSHLGHSRGPFQDCVPRCSPSQALGMESKASRLSLARARTTCGSELGRDGLLYPVGVLSMSVEPNSAFSAMQGLREILSHGTWTVLHFSSVAQSCLTL